MSRPQAAGRVGGVITALSIIRWPLMKLSEAPDQS